MFNKYTKYIFIVIFLHLLNGCVKTRDALEKIEPPISLTSYNSVSVVNDKEFRLKFTVIDNKTKEEGIWCASLPLEKIKNHSKAVNTKIATNSSDSWLFYKHLEPISGIHYKITKSDCNGEEDKATNVITQKIYSNIGPSSEVRSPPAIPQKGGGWNHNFYKNAPIRFLSRTDIRYEPHFYIVFDSNDNGKKFKVAKVNRPLPIKIYDKEELKRLPGYIIYDIVTFPVYFFLYAGLLFAGSY